VLRDEIADAHDWLDLARRHPIGVEES
jgi:hypothetical protein